MTAGRHEEGRGPTKTRGATAVDPLVAPARMPGWVRGGLVVLAVLYLTFVWLDGVGTGAERALPPPARFFVQVAKLFPRAAQEVIEWRARGWRCERERFEELDLAPYFPIMSGSKEDRFDRALFFYHNERRVLVALDEYISRAESLRAGREGRLGGVMLLSLRIPIPAPGSDEPRYERRPIDAYPPSVGRKYWYVTPSAERERRCKEAP